MGPLALLVHVVIGVLPVLAFLAALVMLDSYKLVTIRSVVTVVGAGLFAAVVCYYVNGYLAGATALDFRSYSRYVAPVVEELGKAVIVVALIRAHRVGFLVDAAILGFAVGTGFAIVENVYYQYLVPTATVGTWIVRGFGTAIMHGGCTAIFAMAGLALRERARSLGYAAFLPGLAIAVVLHAAYNHAWLPPMLSTLAVLVVLPPLMYAVFQRSEQATATWLGEGFDADAAMLESLTSGHFGDSPAGQYVASLRARFQGTVVADLLCYLRLHSELALRAKGILMMRESGFDASIDPATREKLAEMEFLSHSIGATGRLALMPLLHAGHRELWQLRMLASQNA
ncbi:MAG TPA: PrsW family glutamic-type intramembrane protease [Casimicrobiaceae bacterium]|jgi:RsiW-degrading membrane proteinase PrsW (M82 family)|nr:PrsW family glutamic-type intramembrane protease [Casimicrobiaceae bacterium]